MTKPTHYDIWIFSKLLVGHDLDGELARISDPFRAIAGRMAARPPDGRKDALDCFLCGRSDQHEWIEAVADMNPEGPPPEGPTEAEDILPCATMADYARIASEQSWLWEGWIASGVLNTVASEPGVGKTRFALDLARRLWFGLPWPDGQVNTLPKETRTLWIQGDRAFVQMLETLRKFGLPDEAVALASSPDDPTGNLDLDDFVALGDLEKRIRGIRPALVVVDTVGMTTARNLCKPEEARAFFAPLMELAAELKVAFQLHTHLSKDGDPLGRRIVEKARVVLKMTCPDPEGQPDRRKLWVHKTLAVKPPPLGITTSDAGYDYDSDPPTEPEPSKPGPPPDQRDKACEFIRDALTQRDNRKLMELCNEWMNSRGSKDTFFKARDYMVAQGELTCEGTPKILSLISKPGRSSTPPIGTPTTPT